MKILAVREESTKMKRDYTNLDLLRAVAVLLVLGSHLIQALGHLDDPWAAVIGVRHLAQLGVLIFFIHTSLVLMMSLDRLEGRNIAWRFYIRRAFRLYPLAILTVIAILAFRIPPHFEPVYTRASWSTIWQNLLLVQNLFRSPDVLGPMWSLPLEVQMYLVLPVIYLAARRINSYRGAAVLMACGFTCWYLDLRAAHYLGQQLFPYAPWFFMGCSAYGLYRSIRSQYSALAYGISLVLFVLAPSVVHSALQNDYRSGYLVWACGVLFAFALPHFREIQSPILRKCAHSIAMYSYGIYLSHVPILWLAFHKISSNSRSAEWCVRLSPCISPLLDICTHLCPLPQAAHHSHSLNKVLGRALL